MVLDSDSILTQHGSRVIGTYLWPLRNFHKGSGPGPTPMESMEVMRESQVRDQLVLITRNGGLFVEPPVSYPEANYGVWVGPGQSEFDDKLAFEEAAALAFNDLVCELALLGHVAEPAAPVHIARGKLIRLGSDDAGNTRRFAVVDQAGGGRESYVERTILPMMHLLGGPGAWGFASEKTLDAALPLQRTMILASVSESLPVLIGGAYSMYSRGLISEALVDAWIVTEQILDHLWVKYVKTMTDSKRRTRLDDNRTYSVAVRIEVLLTAGILDDPTSRLLQEARACRNNLAHRAKTDASAVQIVLKGMTTLIEQLTGLGVDMPQRAQWIAW